MTVQVAQDAAEPLCAKVSVANVLLVVNVSAATGHGEARVRILGHVLAAEFGAGARLEKASGHPAVSESVRGFLMTADSPALVIVGGGGGTLRAAIEAACGVGILPGPEKVRFAALRMGSGNVFAKQLGVPRDPTEGLRAIAAGWRSGRLVRAAVLGFSADAAPRGSNYLGATLGGLGQFGRIPADLTRWHRRFPWVQRILARAIGVERLTTMEYALTMMLRSLLCAIRPRTAELVEIRHPDGRETLRLLAGTVQSFSLAALPFRPNVRLDDEAVVVNLLRHPGRLATLGFWLAPKRGAARAIAVTLSRGERLEITLRDRDEAEFFVDEDPLVFHGRLAIEVAGTLAFVPATEER